MDKLTIARNLEYVGGGLDAIKRMFAENKNTTTWVKLLDEWYNIIFDTIDIIMREDTENVTDA